MALTEKLDKKPKCFIDGCTNKEGPISILYSDKAQKDYRPTCIDHELDVLKKLREDYPNTSIHVVDATQFNPKE